MMKNRKKVELDFYLKADMMMNRGVFTDRIHLKNIFFPDYIMRYLR